MKIICRNCGKEIDILGYIYLTREELKDLVNERCDCIEEKE